MDPLAHTLVGASLAETGLRQKTAWATLTLVIGANLPDIDGVCLLGGADASMAGRRGWTHGVVAWVVLPLVLAGVMYALARRAQRRQPAKEPFAGTEAPPPVSWWWLLGLAALGVWTHPLLDWMNAYGVRLLMPFSSTWFYGDALFIIEPVLWLLCGAAVVFAHGKTKKAAALWLLLLLTTTSIIIVPKTAPPVGKMFWCIGAGLLVYLRIRGKPPSPRITARVGLGLVTVYIVAMLIGTAHAKTQAEGWLRSQNMVATKLVVVPLPATPLQREVIALVGDTYHFFTVAAFGDAPLRPSDAPIKVGEITPAVHAALAASQVQGLVRWLRLPAYEVQSTSDGVVVTIADVRYSRTQGSRVGRAKVWLDRQLRVLQVQH
ncbi:MAG: metal-dependent hydrolase [Deltaproteobacteria bacterium]|nr:metal-dependent hydrolase [Deltaproteobacteria bacterium]